MAVVAAGHDDEGGGERGGVVERVRGWQVVVFVVVADGDEQCPVGLAWSPGAVGNLVGDGSGQHKVGGEDVVGVGGVQGDGGDRRSAVGVSGGHDPGGVDEGRVSV